MIRIMITSRGVERLPRNKSSGVGDESEVFTVIKVKFLAGAKGFETRHGGMA